MAKFGNTVGFLIIGKFVSLILLTFVTLNVQFERVEMQRRDTLSMACRPRSRLFSNLGRLVAAATGANRLLSGTSAATAAVTAATAIRADHLQRAASTGDVSASTTATATAATTAAATTAATDTATAPAPETGTVTRTTDRASYTSLHTLDTHTHNIFTKEASTPHTTSLTGSTDSITDTMDISTNTKLSTAYYQTRNARRAHTKGTEIDMDTGTTKHITKPAIGALDNITGILGTFLASRTNVNTNMHQNFSSSFDPTDHTCITCSTPHNVTKQQDTSTPLTIVLCDQSFPCTPPDMSGSGNCIRLIRIEDAVLAELTDMLLTIFPHGIQHNSIKLLGTAPRQQRLHL